MTYSEKLKDPRWQRKRLEVMEFARWRCQICGDGKKTLHCHHSYYTKGKQPWQYPEGSIICICEPCHDKIHPKKSNPPTSESLSEEIPVSDETKARKFGALRALLEQKLESSAKGVI